MRREAGSLGVGQLVGRVAHEGSLTLARWVQGCTHVGSRHLARVGLRGARRTSTTLVLGALSASSAPPPPTGSSSGVSSRSRPRTPEKPPTRGLHIGFAAPSRAHVDAFWQAGDRRRLPRRRRARAAAGVPPRLLRRLPARPRRQQRRGGAPRPRGRSRRDRRPVVPGRRRRGGEGVLRRARAAHGGPSCTRGLPGHAHFGGERGSFTFVSDDRPATEEVHVAFPATATARRSPRSTATALAAGYRDNGGPGERPEYHPGYFGAFVLDPDGNNVEARVPRPLRWRYWRKSLHAAGLLARAGEPRECRPSNSERERRR